MKDNRHAQTAERYGIRERLEALETDLLTINGVSSVEFDLDSIPDRIPYIIMLIGYGIDPRREDYFPARSAMLARIVETCNTHDLHSTGDRIEDYGEHYYIVRQQGASWKPLPPCKCGGAGEVRYLKEFEQWAVECSKNGHIHNTGFCNMPQEAVKKWRELNA